MARALRFLEGGGEMGERIRAHDWAATPLGPPQEWPVPLRTAVRLLLNTGHPMFIFWGERGLCFYNDAYRRSIGEERHLSALGRGARDVWKDDWDAIGPLIERVMRCDGSSWHEDHLIPAARDGAAVDVYWTYSYSPIDDETAATGVGGVLLLCTETTDQVLGQREAADARERLARMFEQAPGFIAVLDGPEHRFSVANPAYLDLIGRRDVIGKTFAEALPDAAAQGYLDILNTVFCTGEVFRTTESPYRVQPTTDGPFQNRMTDFTLQPITNGEGRVTTIVAQGFDTTDRTLATRALAESEARFRAAVDAVQGVLWTNSAHGEMLGEQRAWSALTGQTPAEYEGYGWADAIHPDDQRPTIDAWRKAVDEARPFDFEHRVRRKDGEWRIFRVRAIPTFGPDGEIVEWIGVHTDITDERLAQDALIESEEHYRAAAELNPQVAWTATPDGLLDRVAERWQEWTGTTGLGTTWGDGLHPDDLTETTSAWVKSFTTGVPYDVEHRVRRVDGTHRWARSRAFPRRNAEGEIIKWYGSTEDIDEQKRAEQQLRESEAQFRGVAEAMPGFVWTADDQGALEYTSPLWHEYSGSAPDESNGAGWAAFVHPDDQPLAFERWLNSVNTGEPYEVEFRLRAQDGTYHWWLARARKHIDGRTRWIGTATELDTIVEARDALERSREDLEVQVQLRTAALRDAEEQLRQSQKLEAVGQLTGGVAHDFNNLLTVIRGSVDLLQRPGITDERRDRYIAAIGETVTRATKLTSQLLAFARRQALQPSVFDVGGAVVAISDMVATLTGARIRVDLRIPDEPTFINADPSQFDTALVNMVVNARDAMSGEGTLTITVSQVAGIPADGMPAVSGPFVAVSIADTGTGIAPDRIHQIFEPFYTTKGVGQGTGLGLSQVYGFTKQSGGEIRVSSAPGRGTIFTMYLAAAPRPEAESKSAPAEQAEAGQGLCILVVEDNAEVGGFARDALDELGFHAVFAEDGMAALRELERDATRFDAVFSDVMMPGMTGVELGKTIRARYPGLPVVLTSGYSQVLAEQGRSGFALLQKPYSMDDLARVLLDAVAARQ